MKRICTQGWTLVKAHFEIEGVHWFPQVEEMMDQQKEQMDGNVHQLDVSFLKHPHRHIFKFDVKVQVHHNDRDIEFIQLARFLRDSMIARFPPSAYGCANFENRSCEMLGEEVLAIFLHLYPQYTGFFMVEVSEDGENSAISKYEITEQKTEVKEDNGTD